MSKVEQVGEQPANVTRAPAASSHGSTIVPTAPLGTPAGPPPGAPPATSRDPRARRALLLRWFVDYNPLQLLGACLMLCGVWFVAAHLDQTHSRFGDLWLLGVLEAYELALLAGAALLMRLAYRRAAGFLGVLAVVLLFGDPTFQLEQLVTMGALGWLVGGAWLLLLIVELRLLARIFALRLPATLWAVVVIAGGAISLLPLALYHGLLDVGSYSAVTHIALVALAALLSATRPQLRRSLASRPPLPAALTHLARWAPIGALAYHAGFVVNAHAPGQFLVLHLVTATLVFTLASGRSELCWSLAPGAALFGAALGAGLPPVPQIALVLIAFAVRKRQLRFVIPIAIGAVAAPFLTGLLPLPRSALGAGASMLAAGFAAMAGGLGLTLRLGRRVNAEELKRG
jgi:hypothetical protein